MAGFKSDENKQLFIKGLREANFTQEEIDREVQDIEGAPAPALPAASAPPPVSTAPPPVVAGAAAPAASVKKDEPSPFALDTAAPARQLKEMEQSREAQNKTLMDSIIPTGDLFPPSRENLPVYGLAAGAALTGYGLYKGSKEVGLGLKSRFFGPKDQTAGTVATAPDRLPDAAQRPITQQQWVDNLSPEERTLYDRSEEAKAARASALESTRNEPFLEPERPVAAPETAPQTPEEIRQARQVAATQAIQQSMAAAPPPEAAPLQKIEPPRPVNPKVSALLQPPMAGAAAPPPALVEPVVVPVAPVETVATTPTPAATDAERVQAIQATEEPAVKATNEKIVEAVTTPKEVPKEEFVPRKWPGTSKGGAGAEGFALQQLGASRATYAKKHAAALEILKERTNGILTQSPSGGGIDQQEQLSKMYEDYTGKPIPRKEGGGWARISDSQIAELHASIYDDLQKASTTGKLKSLGKGSLAAAALLGITEAVQAAQKGNFGPLKEAGFDLGVGALGGPVVMAAQTALTGTKLESGMTKKGQREFQNRQEILNREGVKDYLQMLKQLNPNPADYTKAAEQYLATNPNAPKSKLQKFNEQTQKIRTAQTQKENPLRK